MPHSTADITVALLAIFVSAKILGELFERLRQPAIVGEILAGFLIGPHALGWVAPGEMVSLLGELGVMFLLFRVGLEVSRLSCWRSADKPCS